MDKKGNKMIKNKKKFFIKLFLGLSFFWVIIAFIVTLIEKYSSDEELEKIKDKQISSIERIYDPISLVPTGEVEIVRKYISKENKYIAQINYQSGKGKSIITCDIKPYYNFIDNWLYALKMDYISQKNYIFICSQQDYSKKGKLLLDYHYEYSDSIENFTYIKLLNHKLGDLICYDVIDNSYAFYEDDKCKRNSAGYDSKRGCIKEKCIYNVNEKIEKEYNEFCVLIKEEGTNFSKRYKNNGKLFFESKGNHKILRTYGYNNGKLISETLSHNGKFEEIKYYSLISGDITYELYLKDGKPKYGFRYQDGNKLPMTNSHLREQFVDYLNGNNSFDE